MAPTTLLFIVRLAVALVLYAFLAVVIVMLWRDLAATERLHAARTRLPGRLVILDSSSAELASGSVFPLLPLTSLGRAPTNTVVLADETVSLEHALLHWREGRWWLEDLGSLNGTRLNDEPVTQPALVVAGDIIAVGNTRLKVEGI